MKKIIQLIFIIFGFTAVLWGTKLIFNTYTRERDIVYLWKSGNEQLLPELKVYHSEQVSKELVFHLGPIIIGTTIITLSLSSAFSGWKRKQKKNKKQFE